MPTTVSVAVVAAAVAAGGGGGAADAAAGGAAAPLRRILHVSLPVHSLLSYAVLRCHTQKESIACAPLRTRIRTVSAFGPSKSTYHPIQSKNREK